MLPDRAVAIFKALTRADTEQDLNAVISLRTSSAMALPHEGPGVVFANLLIELLNDHVASVATFIGTTL